MPLAAGSRLGPYEIVAAVGAGGMGEVYRATDTNLKRQVAIKVLPASVANDPERVARFQREAEVLAALNHPNIAHIHGLEPSEGRVALVLELVEGPTLADRIAQGAIPIDEALPIAKQIAEALEAAHEQGIIHRDLKPANIKVRPDGTAKILDFGLAKALDPIGVPSSSVSMSPTITSPAMTQAGIILGTAAYMSPEQAVAKPVDKRSDLWSFGALLFEMLTGRQAFHGETVSHVLASVLKDEPDWAALPATTPVSIRRLLRRCLEKDRRRRLDSAADARLEIDDALPGTADLPQSSASVTFSSPTHDAGWSRWSRAFLLAMAAGVAGLAVGAAVMWARTEHRTGQTTPVARFTINAADRMLSESTGRHIFALSPDGSKLVFVANGQLNVRRMGDLEITAVKGTQNSYPQEPFFSPDGEWIGFWSVDGIKKIQSAGGVAVGVGTSIQPFGAAWTDDRIIIGAGSQGILELPPSGGSGKTLISAKADGSEFLHGPQLLPDGRSLMFTVRTAGSSWDAAQIVVEDLVSHKRQVLIQGGTDARYLPSGHVVFTRDNVLYAVSFDTQHLRINGTPTAIISGVAEAGGGNTGAAQFGVATTGSLVYLPGALARRTLYWRGRDNGEVILPTPPHSYGFPRLSPDGTRIAVDTREQDGDVWIWELEHEALTRLTFQRGWESGTPIWTPDGKSIVYFHLTNEGFDLLQRPADGTGEPQTIARFPGGGGTARPVPQAISMDGRWLLVRPLRKLVLIDLKGDRQPRPLPGISVAVTNADFAPNGRWITYDSDESGASEIYVRPFPETDQRRWQISSGGGLGPRWASNGRELFFEQLNGQLMVVPTDIAGSFSFGKPSKLFQDTGIGISNSRHYDVSPDGKRFLMIRNRETLAPQLVIVQNWTEELRRLVPTK